MPNKTADKTAIVVLGFSLTPSKCFAISLSCVRFTEGVKKKKMLHFDRTEQIPLQHCGAIIGRESLVAPQQSQRNIFMCSKVLRH
jgi:hypothetical protein